MNKLTEQEKARIKLRLIITMGKFIEIETRSDNDIGWIPENIEKLMADAAFAVLECCNALNQFFEEEDLFKD